MIIVCTYIQKQKEIPGHEEDADGHEEDADASGMISWNHGSTKSHSAPMHHGIGRREAMGEEAADAE